MVYSDSRIHYFHFMSFEKCDQLYKNYTLPQCNDYFLCNVYDILIIKQVSINMFYNNQLTILFKNHT